jgi:pyruvate formate lyase activating enzyme
VYGKPYAVNVDPVEKKPLYHFLPGTRILSIGTAGCNMACKYCQNWDISEAKFNEARAIDLPPERLIQLALHYNSQSIAYTYNEPTIFAEYAMDTAKLGHEMNIKNVMVTNGYIAPEAIDEVYKYMDAANVDLKAFTASFYEKLTLSRIGPVLESLKKLIKLNIWIEITNLVIPSYNDNETEVREMCEWILQELGPFVPIHFTAFHPDYKLKYIPPTTPSLLLKMRELAMDAGLKYVYVGNISDERGSNTYCHSCQALLIRRSWHTNETVNLHQGKCKKCHTTIPGIFNQVKIKSKEDLPG